MKAKKVLILGGGLAGLSCAYHLRKVKGLQSLVVEKSGNVGGTARSVRVDGFTFDVTGHLLHLHFPYTEKLIRSLLGDNVYTCQRRAAIYSQGILTAYPYQVHTYGLPKKTVKECVAGFEEAVKKFSNDSLRPTSLPFHVWSERTFGKGIHKHFMKPYNEKLWQVPLDQMTAEWCGMFVPQPKLEDVLRGSREKPRGSYGYNATFLYPKQGGIQVLSDALARGLPVELNKALEEVEWRKKQARLSNGKKVSYDALVSTLPLVELLKRMKGLPEEIRRASGKLRWTSVLCVNLGVDRPAISDKSWIYFPEKKFIFYRVGFPMNFTPHVVPDGCSSMYVEVSHPPGESPWEDEPALLRRIRKDLVSCGIMRKSDRILVQDLIPLKYGYVHYTPDRKEVLDKIFSFLNENRVYSIGRYGAWKYSFMEEAILDGWKTAKEIRNLG